MKLQVVELPDRCVGAVVDTPFLVVLSEVDSFDTVSHGAAELKEQTGARAVLVFEDPVEVLPRVTTE